MNIEIANRLLQYRKKSGLSQDALAEKIGVSRQAVSKWERAEASPDTDNLIILADIYGVTLDELLTGNPEEVLENKNQQLSEDSAENNTNDNTNENTDEISDDTEKLENADEGTEPVDNDTDETTVNFSNGINVNDNGDKVHVGFDGIHVESKQGAKVDIGKGGINVVDENGNVLQPGYKKHHIAKAFPIWIVATIGFFTFGSLGLMGGWATSWLWFLTIPIYYTTVDAIYKRNLSHFCYPVLVVMLFMIIGMCGHVWHPTWMIFLTIPLFYWIAGIIKPKKCENNCCDNCNPESTEKPKSKKGVLGVVIGIVATVFGLMLISSAIILVFGESSTTTETYIIKENCIKNLSFDKSSGELNFLESKKDYSYVEYTRTTRGVFFGSDKMKIKEGSDSVEIGDPSSWSFLGYASGTMNVYLTDNVYDSINIDTASGDTTSDIPIKARSIVIDSASGDVNIKDLYAKKLELDTASGDMNIDGAFFDVTVDSASGDIVLSSAVMPDALSVDAASGDITVSIPDSDKGFEMEYDIASGDIKSDFSVSGGFSNEGTVKYKNGKGKYILDMASGDFALLKNNMESTDLTDFLFSLDMKNN